MATQPHPDAEEISVVLVGSFNPGIFHPEWFRRQEILLPAEAEQASVKAITPEITQILFLDMKLDILPDRFILRTTDVSRTEKLQDVVLGVLSRLNHIPVTGVGINNDIHFDLKDPTYWHKIGHTLVPKELIWNSLYKRPGMQSITIRELRDGDFPGQINVTVQPSDMPKKFRYGLKVATNYHYDVPIDDSGIPRTAKAVEFLGREWDLAIAESRRVAYRIFESIPKDAN